MTEGRRSGLPAAMESIAVSTPVKRSGSSAFEGTTMTIRLVVKQGTSQADLTEAHAIIDSIRTELGDYLRGFRLVFTLPTNDWDSG